MRRLLLLVTAAACQNGGTGPSEAGVDVRSPDAATPGDVRAVALAVDFTVSYCPTLDPAPRCTGRAPLTLEFVPITTGGPTRFEWTFNDGSLTSTMATPIHTYALPGSYDVRLAVGRGTEFVSRQHAGFVVVTPAPIGETCDVDAQCERGLQCVCGSAAKCPAAFLRGFCAAPCGEAACSMGQVCADLTTAGMAAGDDSWRRPLCLRACRNDGDCAAGLRCRDLPGRPPMRAWVRGCFPDHPGAVGTPCRNASGQLRGELCVTGQCLDLGARGVCSLDCANGVPCPPGTGCIELTDKRRLCAPACGAGVPCGEDPLLACEPPNAGPLGFTIVTPAGERFCAPKRCSMNADCGAAGICKDDQNGAHCIRRTE